MKRLAAALSAAMLFAVPAFAQNTDAVGGTQQNEPGTGGTSKPGVQGDVGGKNGPAAKPGDAASSPANTPAGTSDATASDNSKVPGLPGNKSGPAQKPK